MVAPGSEGAAFQVAEEVWREWSRAKDDAQRRAEMQELVQMAADEFRQQVEAIVGEVAAGQPAEVRQDVSAYLEQVTARARRLRQPQLGQEPGVAATSPPKQACDLMPLLSDRSRDLSAPEVPAPQAQTGEWLSPFRPRVTLRITRGHGAGEETVCTEPAILLFGRANDCVPRLPQEGHDMVSRHHCLVEINPPDVRIRDLGSRHGTFINGTLIGKRSEGTDPAPGQESPEHDLMDGTEVRLTDEGQLAFLVRVHVPAQCSVCGAAIPEEEKPACAHLSGGYLCSRCQKSGKPMTAMIRACGQCGKEVTAERGANRPGLLVCAACRANTQATARNLAAQAQAGNPDLRVLQGYSLLEELGRGGMGAVYLARHKATGQTAAIKLMLPKIATDGLAVELFQREIRNTMALRHRHVVRLLDHGFAQGTFFLVLEYCDGGSVERLMEERGGKLAVDEAAEIILQALEGLEYAHQADIPFVRQKDGGYAPGRGLVHRDLKPANLFLTGRGSGRLVKIGDYGLAKAFDEIGLSGGTRTGDVSGTWEFMCRHQVIDYKAARPKVDVWALAATLYNLLTGYLPRHFPEGRDPWLTVLESDPVPILQRNPGLPRKLAELIDHALREEPDLAFQTATEFKHALENVL